MLIMMFSSWAQGGLHRHTSKGGGEERCPQPQWVYYLLLLRECFNNNITNTKIIQCFMIFDVGGCLQMKPLYSTL